MLPRARRRAGLKPGPLARAAGRTEPGSQIPPQAFISHVGGRLLRRPHTCYCGSVLGSGLRTAALQTSPVVPPSDGKVLATGPQRAAPFSAMANEGLAFSYPHAEALELL